MPFEHLSETQIKQLNEFRNFISFIPTWAYEKFLNCHQKTVAQFTGNQFGKTSGTARSYVMRFLGLHPVPEKNAVYWKCKNVSSFNDPVEAGCHRVVKFKNKYTNEIIERKHRSFFNLVTLPPNLKCPKCGSPIEVNKRESYAVRFCAATLPGQSKNLGENGESAESKNTQYPALKRWLPQFMIKQGGDITARNTAMILQNLLDPDAPDLMVDFTAYGQEVQNTAGVQRYSIWYDEEPGLDFRKEQVPRILKENGDEIFTVTPANHITWMYDELYEEAEVYYRTEAVTDYMNSTASGGRHYDRIQYTGRKSDIAVIQAATDDNPTLTKEAIERMTNTFANDEDSLAIRRYGIFKQVSGRIFKEMQENVHVIDAFKYFENGKIPMDYKHGRGIDFHPQTPWGFACVSLSPENEAFVWLDLNPSPEKLTVKEICKEIAMHCGQYRFSLNLIDPLAKGTKASTDSRPDRSSLDAIQEEMMKMQKEGYGKAGLWEPWNTKGEFGRDNIKMRLKNSLICKHPFNNLSSKTGERLPTIWVFSSCINVRNSLTKWRWQEFKYIKNISTTGQKNKPEQAWSHHAMVLESLFKSVSFSPPVIRDNRDKEYNYFRGQ